MAMSESDYVYRALSYAQRESLLLAEKYYKLRIFLQLYANQAPIRHMQALIVVPQTYLLVFQVQA